MIDQIVKTMAVSVGEVHVQPISATRIVDGVLNAVFFIIGSISVIFIIYAGILYLTANGEPAKAKKAMDTITFSIVGLIVSISAYAIVNFVMSNV